MNLLEKTLLTLSFSTGDEKRYGISIRFRSVVSLILLIAWMPFVLSEMVAYVLQAYHTFEDLTNPPLQRLQLAQALIVSYVMISFLLILVLAFFKKPKPIDERGLIQGSTTGLILALGIGFAVAIMFGSIGALGGLLLEGMAVGMSLGLIPGAVVGLVLGLIGGLLEEFKKGVHKHYTENDRVVRVVFRF